MVVDMTTGGTSVLERYLEGQGEVFLRAEQFVEFEVVEGITRPADAASLARGGKLQMGVGGKRDRVTTETKTE